MFRLEHSGSPDVVGVQYENASEAAANVPTGTLDAFCTQIQLPDGNSTLHSKH
jgi:hypothetical protein